MWFCDGVQNNFRTKLYDVNQLSFSELNSIESTESIELVENYF